MSKSPFCALYVYQSLRHIALNSPLLKSSFLPACHLLGDFLEAIKQDLSKSFKIYQTNCDVYEHGHSCLKTGGYLATGKQVMQNMVREQENAHVVGKASIFEGYTI